MNIGIKNGSADTNNIDSGTGEKSAPLPEVYENAWLEFLRASTELSARVERDLKESAAGITLAEFDILNALMTTATKSGRLTVSKLTESTRLSRSAVTRLVDRMAATNGYVQKRRGSDGREVWTEITPVGRAAMQSTLRPAWERAIRTHFADFLNAKGAKVLANIFTLMLRGASDEIDENAP